jgi:hypothetical protein
MALNVPEEIKVPSTENQAPHDPSGSGYFRPCYPVSFFSEAMRRALKRHEKYVLFTKDQMFFYAFGLTRIYLLRGFKQRQLFGDLTSINFIALNLASTPY